MAEILYQKNSRKPITIATEYTKEDILILQKDFGQQTCLSINDKKHAANLIAENYKQKIEATKEDVQTCKVDFGYHAKHNIGYANRCIYCFDILNIEKNFTVEIKGTIYTTWTHGGGGCRVMVVGSDKKHEIGKGDTFHYRRWYGGANGPAGELATLKDSGSRLSIKELNTACTPKLGIKIPINIDIKIPILAGNVKRYIAVVVDGKGWGWNGGNSPFGGRGGNYHFTAESSPLSISYKPYVKEQSITDLCCSIKNKNYIFES